MSLTRLNEGIGRQLMKLTASRLLDYVAINSETVTCLPEGDLPRVCDPFGIPIVLLSEVVGMYEVRAQPQVVLRRCDASIEHVDDAVEGRLSAVQTHAKK